MSKKTKKASIPRNLYAFIAGLGIIYAGSFILLMTLFIAQGVLDIKYGNIWSKVPYMKDVSELNNTSFHNVMGFIGDLERTGGIVVSLIVVLFVFAGWIMLKIAKPKVWYLPALPVIFISLFSFQLTSSGNYHILSMPFTQLYNGTEKITFIAVCLLAALLGGWLKRHVSVHK